MTDIAGRVAVVLTGDEWPGSLRALRGAAWVEVRLDLFLAARPGGDPLRWIDFVRRAFDGRIIATVRSARESGGRGRGIPEAKRLDVYRTVARSADYLDVELESAIAPAVVEEARSAGRKTILSVHDFSRTPAAAAIAASAARCRRRGGDVFKIASRVRSPGDLMVLLSFARSVAGRFPTIVCPMGCGIPERLAPLAFGTLLTYARFARATAPGQPSWRDLRPLAAAVETSGSRKT